MADQATAELLSELGKLITEYSGYETSDQFIVFGLVWTSILASAAAALLVALEKGTKMWVSILAAIPALCFTIDSSFKFSQQYQLRRSATTNLQALNSQLRFEGLSVSDGSKRMREIVRDFKAGSFVPSLTSSPVPAATSGIPAPPASAASGT